MIKQHDGKQASERQLEQQRREATDGDAGQQGAFVSISL